MTELDASLEQNLRALVAPNAGEWQDVVRRARRLEAARSHRRLVVAIAAAAVVLGTGSALAIGHQFFGWFDVTRAREKAPTLPAAAPYVLGRTLYLTAREPQNLSAPLLAPLLGQDATLVVASPDHHHLVYHSWRAGVPLLYLHDTATGGSRLLVTGAQTVAWAADGRIAYVQLDPPRYRSGRAYLGRVVVRRGVSGTPVAWTTHPGAYEVLAWAGDTLLVDVHRCLLSDCPRRPLPGVYAVTPSGDLRALPLATVAAVSPDGRLIFGRYDPVPGQDSPSPFARLVDVRSRRVLETLDLTSAARSAGMRGLITGSLQTAAWRGDEIVATFAGRDSALFFLRARSGRLTIEHVARVRPQILPGRYGTFFGTPSFTGRDSRHVVVPVRATAGGDERLLTALIACDRRTRQCARGRQLGGREWFAIVANPSRPS